MRISDWSSDVCSADLLAEFSTLPFGCTDPEDIAVDPLSGNLFIIGELTRTIYETTQAGELVSSIALPDKLKRPRSEEHTSELQSLMRTSYAVFCLKKKITKRDEQTLM